MWTLEISRTNQRARWGPGFFGILQKKDARTRKPQWEAKMEYDFNHMSDIELVKMQKDLRKYPEDKEFLNAVLKELGERQKKRQNKK